MDEFLKQQKGSSNLTNVLKWYYEYFKIYKLCSNSCVSKWKQADIDNTLKWSKFVEEVYKKINKKSYLSKLLDNLTILAKHWSLNIENINDFIKNATFNIKNVGKIV